MKTTSKKQKNPLVQFAENLYRQYAIHWDNPKYDWLNEAFFTESAEFVESQMTEMSNTDYHQTRWMVNQLCKMALVAVPPELKASQARLIRALESTMRPDDLFQFQYGQRTMVDSEIYAYATGRLSLKDPEGLLARIEDVSKQGGFPEIIINLASESVAGVQGRDPLKWTPGNPDAILDIFPESIRDEARQRIWNSFCEPASLNYALKWILYGNYKDNRGKVIEPASLVIGYPDLYAREIKPFESIGLTTDESLILLAEHYSYKDFLGKNLMNANNDLSPEEQKTLYKNTFNKLLTAKEKDSFLQLSRQKSILESDITFHNSVMKLKDHSFLEDKKKCIKLFDAISKLSDLEYYRTSPHRVESFSHIYRQLRLFGTHNHLFEVVDKVLSSMEKKLPRELVNSHNDIKSLNLNQLFKLHLAQNSDSEKVLPVLKAIAGLCDDFLLQDVFCTTQGIDYIRSLSKEAKEAVYEAFTGKLGLDMHLVNALNVNWHDLGEAAGNRTIYQSMELTKEETLSFIRKTTAIPLLDVIAPDLEDKSAQAIKKMMASPVIKKLEKGERKKAQSVLDRLSSEMTISL